MRLDQLLTTNHISRKKMKQSLLQKQILVDGKPACKLSQNVDTGLQQITFQGKQVSGPTHRYYTIRTFGDVFVPLLPAIVATGLFMGIRGAIAQDQVLSLFGTTAEAFKATNFYTYTVVLTDTAFAFFPALICWSAFRVFGGNPLIGLVLGLMMVNSALPNAWDVAGQATKFAVDPSKDILDKIANMDVLGSLKFTSEVTATKVHPIYFFGFIPVVGYQNSVLPAFFVGLFGMVLLDGYLPVPDVRDYIVTPAVAGNGSATLGNFVLAKEISERHVK